MTTAAIFGGRVKGLEQYPTLVYTRACNRTLQESSLGRAKDAGGKRMGMGKS